MKSTSATFSCLLFFSLSACVIGAQQTQSSAKKQSIASDAAIVDLGNEMVAYKPLPKDFNVSMPTDSDLARYGLPPKPDQNRPAAERKHWADLVEAAKHRIIPELKTTDVFSGPIRRFRAEQRNSGDITASGGNDNWSGYVIVDPNNVFAQQTTVTGSYNVPLTADCTYNPGFGIRTWSSHWIGIDGFSGSADVFQIGTSSDNACNEVFGGAPHGLYYAWLEWFPNPQKIITNLPIVPGDSIVLTVTAVGPGNYTFSITDINRLNVTVTIGTGPPPGATFVGNSIEWIVERPSVNGALTTLAPYVNAAWYDMFAKVNGVLYRPSLAPTGTTYNLIMYDANNNVLSSASLFPPTAPAEIGDAAIFSSYRPY